MKISATGDYLAQKRLIKDDGFKAIKEYISDSDVRFTNLETTIHTGEQIASQFCGGAYLYAPIEILDDIKDYGFNMITCANNHAMDFHIGGIISTLNNVRKHDLVQAGMGMNMEEASAPAYMDTPHGKVALIGATATFANSAAIAGYSLNGFPGRPGINPCRGSGALEVTSEEFDTLKDILERSGYGDTLKVSRSEGFQPDEKEGEYTFNGVVFRRGTETKWKTWPNKSDLERITSAIKEARKNSDIVLMTAHMHPLKGNKETPADFVIDYAHACIDSGADAFIGHGPHLLRGIEIYKGHPIFYSLGDFMMQEELTPKAPHDLYVRYNCPSDKTIGELFDVRSHNRTRGLKYQTVAFEAVVAKFTIDDDTRELEDVELLPIEMGFGDDSREGLPSPCFDKGILERLTKLSEPFGTKITIDDKGYGHVVL